MSQPSRPSPGEPMTFACGATMKNRFMLAPMTNHQSHEDGRLSDAELHWLVLRAQGNFGLTMTCASHVHPQGKGFPGQLGIYSDDLLDGHMRLAEAIRGHGSLAVVQLHHAGMRSPRDLIEGPPVCPSADAETGSRALALDEVHQLRDDFIAAAVRCQRAGYDGVEVHGAHGYILCQFLSTETNRRQDAYGGSLENRARIIQEIITGIRAECGRHFLVGLRLSPESSGIDLAECMTVSQDFIDSGLLDFLDLSLWDSFKQPADERYAHQSLLQYVTGLDKKNVRLTVAGKISTAREVQTILDAGIDFVTIGRGGILHHDYPDCVMADPDFEPVELPVSPAYLRQQGLGEDFVAYMRRWKGFVVG
jgi:2,4-dienoyl-CoA reductase-like NADH-dependent reductase (Old Yellow Enzyme family)